MQLTEHLHSLAFTFTIPIAPGRSLERYVHAFLLFGDRILLIDSGVRGSKDALLACVTESGRNPSVISTLVLTHAHPDHIGGAKAIQDSTRCQIAIHEKERAWAEDTEKQFRERPIPGFHTFVEGSVRADRLLRNGDLIDAGGGVTLEVIHTPGHSPGSISLLCRKDRALITGDAIPVPGGLPIYDDYPASVRSLQTLKDVSGVDTVVSSWDAPRSGTECRGIIEESIRYLGQVHEAVVEQLQRPTLQDPMDLCRAVVARLGLPPASATPHLARTFQSHVKHYRKQGSPGTACSSTGPQPGGG